MKYMVSGGFQKNPLMRLTLGLTLLLLVGFWVTVAALYFARMDLTPSSVVAYYCGLEAEFRPPRSYQSMLEVTHGHLAMMAMVLLLLTHLVIFLPASKRWKTVFICLTFGSSLLGEASGWLVRFVHPGFAVLKVGSFVLLELCLGGLLLALGVYLWRGPGPAAKPNGGPKGRELPLRAMIREARFSEVPLGDEPPPGEPAASVSPPGPTALLERAE